MVSLVSSFTRTIPQYKTIEEVSTLLSLKNQFLPLAYRPTRARPGDFIYLVFRGIIVGRARISTIDAIDFDGQSESSQYPAWAKWAIRYTGAWEKPPREILVRGHQSIRYLEQQSLVYLDLETW